MKQGLNWVVESMKVEKQSRFLRAEGWGRMQWAVGIQGEGNDIHSNYLSNRPWISWTFLVTSSKTQLKWAQVKKKKRRRRGLRWKNSFRDIDLKTQDRARNWRFGQPGLLPLLSLLCFIQKGFLHVTGRTAPKRSCITVLKPVIHGKENEFACQLTKSGEKFWSWDYLSLGYTPTTVGMRMWGLLWFPSELHGRRHGAVL